MAAAILLWLLVVNVAAFAAFAVDKRRAAAGARRIPERTLLTLAAVGGSLGAFAGRRLLRHKTRRQPFGAWLWLIAAVQVAVVAVAAAWMR